MSWPFLRFLHSPTASTWWNLNQVVNQYTTKLRISVCLFPKASKVGCFSCSLNSDSLHPCPKLSCQLAWQTDMFVVLSADARLSQLPEHFQSSLGYKSQQDSPLDFIYHWPWIMTDLSLSLALITYFRFSHRLRNLICPSDDLLWSFICPGPRPHPSCARHMPSAK